MPATPARSARHRGGRDRRAARRGGRGRVRGRRRCVAHRSRGQRGPRWTELAGAHGGRGRGRARASVDGPRRAARVPHGARPRGSRARRSLAIGPGWFAIFAGLVVLFAQGEFYLALQKRHYQPATALGLVSGALVLGAGYYRGEGAMLAIMALSLFATFLWYMTVPPPHRRNVVTNIALTVLGVVVHPAARRVRPVRAEASRRHGSRALDHRPHLRLRHRGVRRRLRSGGAGRSRPT